METFTLEALIARVRANERAIAMSELQEKINSIQMHVFDGTNGYGLSANWNSEHLERFLVSRENNAVERLFKALEKLALENNKIL